MRSLNAILVSPEEYMRRWECQKFFFTKEGGKRKFKLEITPCAWMGNGIGHVFYRGRYIKAVKLGK